MDLRRSIRQAGLAGFGRLPRQVRRRGVRLGTPSFTVGGVLVATDAAGRVLLVRQRHSRTGLGLPGGLLRRGEAAAEALRRELVEEIGIRTDVTRPAAVLVDPLRRRVDLIFAAGFAGDPAALRPDGQEVTEILLAGAVGVGGGGSGHPVGARRAGPGCPWCRRLGVASRRRRRTPGRAGMRPETVAVVLAAGAGRRLRPLSTLVPKALCPVNNVPLLDRALAAVGPYAAATAVNVHAGRDQMLDHLDRAPGTVRISVEHPVALGTAGALGRLRDWIDGRDVLVHNADAYLPGGVAELVDGWDRRRCRLLVTSDPARGDFGDLRYVGACLLPRAVISGLAAEPSGLYERLWRGSDAVDFAVTTAVAIDCGTPRDYLRANLHAAGGTSVIGAGAVVEGEVVRSVVWPGGRVRPDERLVEVIRAGATLTVAAPLGPVPGPETAVAPRS